ncbi:hypothetical protein WA026_019798 [Henosepilachna vigintioctopunctata]|uniref:Uncharacterized protein n=1 Tax=Henosepilachna vigintioctopunctata TaxID=420089 RepID=A0AAW1VFQ6_9CUCU
MYQEDYDNDEAEMQEEPIDDEICVDAAQKGGETNEEVNLADVTSKEAITGDEAAEWMELSLKRFVVQYKTIPGN